MILMKSFNFQKSPSRPKIKLTGVRLKASTNHSVSILSGQKSPIVALSNSITKKKEIFVKDNLNFTNDSEENTAGEVTDSQTNALTRHRVTKLSNNFIDKDFMSIDTSTRHQNYFKRSDAYMRPARTTERKKRIRKENVAFLRRDHRNTTGIQSVRKLSPSRGLLSHETIVNVHNTDGEISNPGYGTHDEIDI